MRADAKWVVGLLIFSLGINAYLFFNGKSNQRNLETAIIMNEFAERETELGKFNFLLSKIADKGDDSPFPNEELFWILGAPARSTVPEVADIRNPVSESYKVYSNFLVEFDWAFQSIVKSLEANWSQLSDDQLTTITKRLVSVFKSYQYTLPVWSVHSSNKKFNVEFEPQIEILNDVISELKSVRDELDNLAEE